VISAKMQNIILLDEILQHLKSQLCETVLGSKGHRVSTRERRVEKELETLMTERGVHLPADWKPGVLKAYQNLRRSLKVLHSRRPPELEPLRVACCGEDLRDD
jgi:hypothetical protein